MNDIPGIDPQGLVRLNKIGGPDFVGQMIDLFLEEAPERLVAAREAEQAGDIGAVADAAHALKSSARNFGAERLADLAENLEITARSKSGENISALLHDLEQAYPPVKAWLEIQRDSLKK